MIARLPGILEMSGEMERRTQMLSLVLAAIFFAGIHLGVAGTTWRDRAVAALGEGAYRAAFSIASLVGIIWLVMAYRHVPYVTTWGVPVWWKPIAIMLMLPAFLLAVIGLTASNPTIVGEEGRVARPPEGIVRVTGDCTDQFMDGQLTSWSKRAHFPMITIPPSVRTGDIAIVRVSHTLGTTHAKGWNSKCPV
jgi:NnrU protein